MKNLLASVVLVFGFGCATSYGIKVDGSKYSQVVEGTTTSAQLQNIFGEPQSIMEDMIQKKYIEQNAIPKNCGAMGDRINTWMYTYTKAGYGSSTMEMKRFIINKEGVVCLKQSHKHGI